MEIKNKSGPIYIRMFRSPRSQPEKLLMAQSNPNIKHNPNRLKKEMIKKIRKAVCVDSSYYLG